MQAPSVAPVVSMTAAQYLEQPDSHRGVWETERTDWPKWQEERHLYMGKRTLLWSTPKGPCLLIEGLGMEIAG